MKKIIVRLYLFWFLHQTTTSEENSINSYRCISFDSYIKPQHSTYFITFIIVVSLLIPTSNHNSRLYTTNKQALYLFWFLHQTTTVGFALRRALSCISFDSYIKPQLAKVSLIQLYVVSLLIPTSNHNLVWILILLCKLYLFWFLHQTTTLAHDSSIDFRLYLFWFLHQTTTWAGQLIKIDKLYLFWFLHQTTTWCMLYPWRSGLYLFWFLHQTTTFEDGDQDTAKLYLFWFLHQTTTQHSFASQRIVLYLFWFLHQTTTILSFGSISTRCISFDSYIKPQPSWKKLSLGLVVSLLIPTSNHNQLPCCHHTRMLYLFWFLHQTTTISHCYRNLFCCISFDSYIKPQLAN